jgi:DNA-binding Xre family transcriptional regulator
MRETLTRPAQIRFMTLDALCREPSCQSAELLEFVPGAEDAVAQG